LADVHFSRANGRPTELARIAPARGSPIDNPERLCGRPLETEPDMQAAVTAGCPA